MEQLLLSERKQLKANVECYVVSIRGRAAAVAVVGP